MRASKGEGASERLTNCKQLKMKASRGKKRLKDCDTGGGIDEVAFSLLQCYNISVLVRSD